MKSKPNIDQLVEETLDSVSSIETITTPTLFKEKVLNRRAKQHVGKVVDVRYLDWFTPAYQAAALICFVVLNTFALLSYTTESTYVENIENFADVYGFSETTVDLYLYQD